MSTTAPASIAPAYLIGTHRYSFRSGQSARIIGVEYVTPPSVMAPPRACYHVEYPDGVRDYVAIADASHYILTNKP